MEDSSHKPRSPYTSKSTARHDGHMHLSRADLSSLAGTKDASLETHVLLRRTGSVDIFAGPPSPSSRHHHQQGTGSSYTYTTNTPGLASNNTSGSTSFRRPSPPPPSSSAILPPAYPSSSHHHHHHQSPAVSKSSTAVLSALRALQDKIKRLEKERADAIVEVGMLRQQLEGMQRRAEIQRREDVLELQEQCSHVQGAYERLLSEKEEMESKLVRSEEKRAGLIQEAGRLRRQLLSEEESQRVAEARVRGMEARIGKMERAVQNRGVAAEDTIAELREALGAETARRLELEERNEKFGEVLLSVLDMNQELARHYPVPETKSRGTTTGSRTSASSTSRIAPKPRPSWTSSNNGGILPFLPASHHRTYNLLATLSLAVRECKQREPKQVLDALYELVQQDSGSVIGREERRAFPLSSGSASASFPSTTRARGTHMYLAKGRRRSAAAERAEEEERQQEEEERQQQQQREAEEHDEEVVLAVQAELEEVESLLEEELRGLNRKYAGMVELARRGGKKTPGSGGGGGGGEGEFREEDLRALIEDIHRKEAELKHLRRALRSKRGHCNLRSHHHHQQQQQQRRRQQQQQQQQVPCTSPRAKSAAQRVRERMSLLSGIRDVSGLAAAGK